MGGDGDMSVRVERDGPVTTVVLSRPEVRNAVDPATAEALRQAFREFEGDAEAAVSVLWGEGGTFCAGFDLKSVAANQSSDLVQTDVEAGAENGPMGPTRMLLSKPAIAAVAGYAVAGGLELALWCDLRVMEEDAVLGVFNRRWGVPLIDGGTVRLPRLIGVGRALDLILTGRPVGAQEALAIGLVSRVVPRGQARRTAEELARELAGFPQACLRSDRRSAYAEGGQALADALAAELRFGQEALRTEAVAGARRFAGGAGRHGSFASFATRSDGANVGAE
jgi:enoyl-CoA hydratase